MRERLPQSVAGVGLEPGRRRLLRRLGAGLALLAQGRPGLAQRVVSNAALLVASVNLKGSIFAASVVMVLRVPGEETIGVILNLPGAATPPDEALPEPEGRISGLYRGGPLSPGVPFAVAESDQALTGTLAAIEGIRFAAGMRNVRALLGAPGVGRSKVFLGYAGWAPGQLAQEIRAGYWDVRSLAPAHLFDPDPQGQWARLNGAGRAI